ncbi:MAG: imidazole glycerol phosphate synthase subunit HisH [Lachnospiraceae bacterium]|nr:imidazole glycerol phosphate synthase subunit HisH [Lachnospiraceae bacterium]
MIAIIDYGAGNLRSVEKAFAYLGYETVVSSDENVLLSADKIVLPGVGAFADAMNMLRDSGLDLTVKKAVERKIPLLGICLGMQMLFESSEEGAEVPGLAVFKGKIKKFEETSGFKIPQIGWNSIKIKEGTKLFKDIPNDSYVYFVHSYYLDAEDKNVVAATCDYIHPFHAAVESGNVFACQFHPEKSGKTGLAILKNFAEM